MDQRPKSELHTFLDDLVEWLQRDTQIWASTLAELPNRSSDTNLHYASGNANLLLSRNGTIGLTHFHFFWRRREARQILSKLISHIKGMQEHTEVKDTPVTLCFVHKGVTVTFSVWDTRNVELGISSRLHGTLSIQEGR